MESPSSSTQNNKSSENKPSEPTTKKKVKKKETSRSNSYKEAPPKLIREKIKEKIEKHYTSEAIFALCGPIGSPIHEVGQRLRSILIEKYGYNDCIIIRLGQQIHELGLKIGENLNIGDKNKNRFEDVKRKIEIADKLRKEFGNSFLAEYAVQQIRNDRLSRKNGPDDTGELKIIASVMLILN